jgi:hypothetical protein
LCPAARNVLFRLTAAQAALEEWHTGQALQAKEFSLSNCDFKGAD